MSSLSELLDVEEWSDASVVEDGDGLGVRMSYRTACHNYAMGVSLAFFMATTVVAYAILWRDHLPASVVQTAVPFFVVFSAVGWVVVVLAYVAPVRLYETMEETDQ